MSTGAEKTAATVPPTISADAYIQERVKQYQSWYDKKSVRCKALYLRMRGLSVAAGVLVPVLANLQTQVVFYGHQIPVTRVLVTILGLLVALLVSLEGVFHYREQWKNYRSTEQFMGHELFLFSTRVGRYKDLTDQDAFQLFVERIEDAIASENAATLNVMTVASDTAEAKK